MITGQQFLRAANLVVSSSALGQGRDLSQLHFRFRTEQADLENPDTLVVRIYNLNDQTEAEVINQYDTVSLQAGYQGTGMQTLFVGQIKMFRRGKESATDRFLEISAADTDLGYNYGLLNSTLSAGASQADVLNSAAAAMQTQLDSQAISATEVTGFGGVFPRGKVLFGLARVNLRTIAATSGSRWFIRQGVLTFVRDTGYLDGQVVVVSPETGLIGVPEATTNGIEIQTLINPYLRVGQRLQIASSLINSVTSPAGQSQALAGGIQFPSRTGVEFYSKVESGQGIYRAVVIEHEGDTREQEWYSKVTCLIIDPSAPQNNSVPAA